MQKSLYLTMLLAAALLLLTGCGAEQAMKKGDRFYALGEYFDASGQYKKAYAQTPNKERINLIDGFMKYSRTLRNGSEQKKVNN